MKSLVWMFFAFLGMMLIAPVLMIMIALARTDFSIISVIFYWLPFAILSSLALTYWYSKHNQKLLGEQ